jgi:DNA adenine methylase
MNAPTRPVLRWYGGKWKLAPWIISHFPKHRVYVEPFGGAASVLLRKNPSFSEIYNDLDDGVVNLFRVLRDRVSAARLIELLRLTPFARAEFELSYQRSECAIESARRLIVRSYMGFGSDSTTSASTGFRAQSPLSGRSPEKDWKNYPDALAFAADRLSQIVVERRPAPQILKRHDAADTLHYVDPPYVPETRSQKTNGAGKQHSYRHELDSGGHVELIDVLHSLKGMVVLSGYPSMLYDEALADWRRVETPALADGARPRTEVLWLNPSCASALDHDRGKGTLFQEMGVKGI